MQMKQKILFSLLAGFLAAAAVSAQTIPDPVYMKKTATPLGDDRYKLTMESFVTGVNTDCDIVMIMDFSSSMGGGVGTDGSYYTQERQLTEENKITTAVKGKVSNTKITSQSSNWTYSNIANRNYPFYLYNGSYYKVQRANNLGGDNNVRGLWIDTPDGRKYLTGSSLSDDPGSVTTDTGTIWTGTLYGGYTWANIVTGTTPGETTMNYLYNGEYYPVKRNRFNADGSRNDSGAVYALWIDTPYGIKFLFGNGVQDTPDASITNNGYYIYYGTLYSGGWTYSNITADNTYFYLKDGVYYPVKRSNAMSDGKGNNDTRALWIEIGGVRKYLKGDGLADDYVTSVHNDNQGIFYGVLYSGGWSYTGIGAGDTSGQAANQWYYRYTDGEYYPVRRANNLGSGGKVRALWICLDPGSPDQRKYLSGQGLSDSFDESITTNDQVIYLGPLYKGWTYTAVGNSERYYKHSDDNYYPVKQEHVASRYNLYVEIDGAKYYLSGNGLSPSVNPYAANNTNISLFFGDLYYGRSKQRRADYLKTAAIALIEELAKDANEDDLHHRMALVQLNCNSWADGTSDLAKPCLDAIPLVDKTSAHVISDFKDILAPGSLDELKSDLSLPNDFPAESYYSYAYSLANGLFLRELGDAAGTDINQDGTIEDFEVPTLTGEQHDNYVKRPRIVITIGDFEATTASAAATWAGTLKAASVNATLISVYVNTSDSYLDRAKAWSSSPAEKPDKYVRHDTEFDEDFVNTLKLLVKDIRKAAIELGAGTVVQDVIADGFVIPDPSADVKVYTAPYATGMAKEEMTFGPRVDKSSTLTPVITTDGEDRPMVKVKGFDYTEEFCAQMGGVPHGNKLILEIEVERTSAVGGPSTATNADGSGMKYSDTGTAFVGKFTNPAIVMPVNIQIEKRGLAKGESAVFTVSPVDADGNPVDEAGGSPVKPFRAILTGNADGTPVSSTLKNLNGNCYWLVTEDNWSWDYEVNGGNPSLSSKTQLLNPFVFTNVKQGTTVKQAESKVSNDFSSGTATTVNSR